MILRLIPDLNFNYFLSKFLRKSYNISFFLFKNLPFFYAQISLISFFLEIQVKKILINLKPKN